MRHAQPGAESLGWAQLELSDQLSYKLSGPEELAPLGVAPWLEGRQ